MMFSSMVVFLQAMITIYCAVIKLVQIQMNLNLPVDTYKYTVCHNITICVFINSNIYDLNDTFLHFYHMIQDTL